jgi:RNA polymerase sigma-70 factor (ECF subfamily)
MGERVSLLSDEELMKLVLHKNHAAYAELVTRHSSQFYALAYRTLFDKVAAEDAVQEAFLKLWRQPELWNGDMNKVKFTTWFYRVVLNLCLDINKKKKPLPLVEGFDVPDEKSDLESQLYLSEQKSHIDKAIALLPEQHRTALNLCFYEKCSNQQAADIMGVSLKALQSMLMRSKAALKQQITISIEGVH